MTKKSELTDLDKAAFKDAMKGVKPLTHTKINPSAPTLPLKRRQKPQLEHNNSDLFQFSDYEIHESIGCDDLIEFFRSGIQQKTIRKMHSGQYEIEGTLDLHGLTVIELEAPVNR